MGCVKLGGVGREKREEKNMKLRELRTGPGRDRMRMTTFPGLYNSGVQRLQLWLPLCKLPPAVTTK